MDAALRYIGIAKKSGKLISGTQMVCDELHRGGKNAVFCASDASEATVKRLNDKCSFYGCRFVMLTETCASLAHGIGKTGSVAAVYIVDDGLSRAAVAAASDSK